MARQCWDEARHCEISVKLSDWMGTEIGEFAESTFLYEAACNPDPVLRLTGVNRALEGLAIDVFNTMREFGDIAGDPVLEFCEDWMLADEVTHVKMGSDWLRRLTANDPERRARALEFQRVVDKLFSLGGFRGEEDDSPIRLARRFRELAGFDDEEIDEIAELVERVARRPRTAEQEAASAAGSPRRRLTDGRSPSPPRPSRWCCSTPTAIVAAVEQLAGADRPAGRRRRRDRGRRDRSPLGRAQRRRRSTRSRCQVEGGAFEDPQHPRQLSEHAVHRRRVGRLLFQVRDRLDPGLRRPARRRRPARWPTGVAWDVYAVGRLGRSSATQAQRQRRLYHFRNRHGFTDAADAAFEQLWTAERLTWADIDPPLRRRRGRARLTRPIAGRLRIRSARFVRLS